MPSFYGLLIKYVFFKTKSFPEQAGEGLRFTVRVSEQTKKRRGNQIDTICPYHSDSHGAWQPDRFRSSPLARIELIYFLLFNCLLPFMAVRIHPFVPAVPAEIGEVQYRNCLALAASDGKMPCTVGKDRPRLKAAFRASKLPLDKVFRFPSGKLCLPAGFLVCISCAHEVSPPKCSSCSI